MCIENAPVNVRAVAISEIDKIPTLFQRSARESTRLSISEGAATPLPWPSTAEAEVTCPGKAGWPRHIYPDLSGFDSLNCVLSLFEQPFRLSSPRLVQDPPEMSVSRSLPSLVGPPTPSPLLFWFFNGSAVRPFGLTKPKSLYSIE
jgi:hypothetical protein